MNFKKSFFILCFISHSIFASETILELGQKVNFKVGDIFKLKNTKVVAKIEKDNGTKCAVPGFNCGSGFIPPHPILKLDCENKSPCPYVVTMIASTADSGMISFESEETCLLHDPKNCFFQMSKGFKTDVDCMMLKTPMAQYYCLEGFPKSTREENKKLCGKLPENIYALRWNCYYDYAIRYLDPNFCDQYTTSPDDISGRNRCYLKMAELLKNKKFCEKISKSVSDSYLEQCLK